MKKLLVLLILFWFSCASAAELSKEAFLEKAPHLKKLLESANGLATFEGFKDIGSLYEVIIKTPDGKKVAYVTKDFNYLILGSIYNKEAKNLTKERVEDLNKIDLSTIPLNEALIQKFGNGEKKVVVFVDPFCPHCKNLINHLKTKTNYTLYMFLFPLGEKNKETALKILCSDKAPVEAYLEADKLEKTCDQAKDKLDKHLALALQLNLRGTPFVILGDGRNFYGANLQMLDEYLGETKATSETKTEKK